MLQRIVIIPFLILVITLLTSCTNEEGQERTNKVAEIKTTTLSEESLAVANAIGANVSVFPITWTSKDHMELHFAIDYYEDGKFTSTILEIEDSNLQRENSETKNSTIYFSINKIADLQMEEWKLTHNVNNGLLSNSVLVNENVDVISTTFTTDEQDLILGKDTILQVIVRNPERLNAIENSEKLFENDKAKLQEVIEQNKYVYVLRVKPVRP
jgi:hypothetical protein